MARFSKIDESNRHDHTYLREGDECYFLFEYTAGKNYGFSATNNLISNLKKKPSLAGTAQYYWKGRAIDQCVVELREAINVEWLRTATLVPVPGSKAAGDPDYDDRMEQICRRLMANADVRNLVIQTASTQADHEAGQGERLTLEDLTAVYSINEQATQATPSYIAIVDDVLTQGKHYRAMQAVLEARFPGVPIIGFFIARCVHAAPDGWDFESLLNTTL